MVRHILTALVALSLLAGGVAGRAETTGQRPPTANNLQVNQECIALPRVLALITLGLPGPRQVTLDIDRDTACDGSNELGAWGLGAYRGFLGGTDVDSINEESCPALAAYANRLRGSVSAYIDIRTAAAVSVGPFILRDSGDLFHIRSRKDRRAAARWLRDTLEAVGPCWNRDRDGQPLLTAKRFYDAAGIRLRR
jgi:hypothetical protein